jgi:hypothetical protein
MTPGIASRLETAVGLEAATGPRVPSRVAVSKPLYSQVRDLLIERIAAGHWPPDASLLPIPTMATACSDAWRPLVPSHGDQGVKAPLGEVAHLSVCRCGQARGSPSP